jgi:hypothetical protein
MWPRWFQQLPFAASGRENKGLEIFRKQATGGSSMAAGRAGFVKVNRRGARYGRCATTPAIAAGNSPYELMMRSGCKVAIGTSL